jgi:hypothetical protein
MSTCEGEHSYKRPYETFTAPGVQPGTVRLNIRRVSLPHYSCVFGAYVVICCSVLLFIYVAPTYSYHSEPQNALFTVCCMPCVCITIYITVNHVWRITLKLDGTGNKISTAITTEVPKWKLSIQRVEILMVKSQKLFATQEFKNNNWTMLVNQVTHEMSSNETHFMSLHTKESTTNCNMFRAL